MLRKWLSIVVMLAFVVSAMPSFSHASMPSDMGTAEVVKVEPVKSKHPCHEAAEKTAPIKTALDDAPVPGKKSCCDGATCECLGNACNGAAKILGMTSVGFLPVVAKEAFTTPQDRMASSLSERIKRPPRS